MMNWLVLCKSIFEVALGLKTTHPVSFLCSEPECVAAVPIQSSIIGGSCHKYNFCRDKRRVLSQPKYDACRDYKTFVATDKHNFVATKYFCHDQTFVATNICRDTKHVFVVTIFVVTSILLLWQKMCFGATKTCLSRQKWACRDKSFVVTKLCLLLQIFVVTKLLSWQKDAKAYFCHDKRCVLSRPKHVCHDKSKLVVTKVLSWQNYVCCYKYLSWQNFCCNKSMFLATKVLSWQAYFCHDKRRVLSRQTWQTWYLWQLLAMIELCAVFRSSAPSRRFFLLTVDITMRDRLKTSKNLRVFQTPD